MARCPGTTIPSPCQLPRSSTSILPAARHTLILAVWSPTAIVLDNERRGVTYTVKYRTQPALQLVSLSQLYSTPLLISDPLISDSCMSLRATFLPRECSFLATPGAHEHCHRLEQLISRTPTRRARSSPLAFDCGQYGQLWVLFAGLREASSSSGSRELST
jgi:hypothetical protein